MNEACRFTKKGEVIYKLQRMLLDEYGPGSVYSSVDELLKKIENTVLDCRSADVAEVVRCKDCRYFKKIVERSDSGLCHRDIVASAWKENGYCSRGERKER